ncbi:MAG: hypothetical protein IPK85_20175 [Gemmatimonadetes bacterium]|nr:hypothetical protein [Gemmatimonadota bacterium]
MKAAWLLAATCLACYSPFDPMAPRGATLRVDIGDDSIGVRRVRAYVDPGRATNRHRRLIASPLIVLGVPFAFVTPSNPAIEWQEVTGVVPTALALGDEPLSMTLPRIEGLVSPLSTLALSTVRSVTGDTLVLAPDGSLTLSLVVAEGNAPVLGQRWSLELVGASVLSIGGTGHPPARLVVPPELVPAPHAQGTWHALLSFTERQGVAPPPGRDLGRNDLSVDASWSQRVRMRIRKAPLA